MRKVSSAKALAASNAADWSKLSLGQRMAWQVALETIRQRGGDGDGDDGEADSGNFLNKLNNLTHAQFAEFDKLSNAIFQARDVLRAAPSDAAQKAYDDAFKAEAAFWARINALKRGGTSRHKGAASTRKASKA